MKKGSKKQSNVTRVLQFFKEGDENEIAAVLFLMGPIINARSIPSVSRVEVSGSGKGHPMVRRRRRLNGADPQRDAVPQIKQTVVDATYRDANGDDVETHKGRVAHALAHTPSGGE